MSLGCERPARASTGYRLHATVHDGKGPHALLLHGALGSRSYWDDNLEALKTVCRPVVIELWGHGRSPSPTDLVDYEPRSYVNELERLRVELGDGEVWLIGQSMGAALVLHYVLAHPTATIGLVITNSASAFSDPGVWRERTDASGLADSIEQGGVEVLRDSWINPGRSRRISDAVRARLADEFAEHDPEGIAGSFRITNRSLPLGERLADIGVPALLTNGVDEERFQALLPVARRIPNLEIVDLPAAHAVNAHDPQGWNAAVVEFMRRHRPPA